MTSLELAACATACIISRANHGNVDAAGAAKVYQAQYRTELEAGYPAGWTAACAAGRDFRAFLLARGLRDLWALGAEVQFASMYAAAVYGIPASCWTVAR